MAKPDKGNQGKRYSVEEKAEIVAFISSYDAENKRGGMKAASDKFGVSVVTLSNWKNKGKSPKKRRVKRTVAKKSSKAVAAKPVKVAETPEAILTRLQAIRSEIHILEKEYNGLKKKL